MPQVGRHPHLGDGHRDMRELGVVHLAAGEDLGQRAADHLADAQLALARARRRRGVLSLPCRSHPIAGAAKSRAGEAMADEVGIAVVGASGRMGRMLVRAVRRDARRAAERRDRAAGAPLDRPRPRRGDGRRAARRAWSRTTRSRSSPAARRCSTSPRPAATMLHAELAAQARLTHVDRHHRARARAPRAAGGGGAARGDRARRQHERRREPPDGAGPAGGGGARARLRHRDRRDAPPREGRRALGHRADARRGGGGRAAGQPRRRRRARPRRRDRRAGRRARSASPACAAATSSASTR